MPEAGRANGWPGGETGGARGPSFSDSRAVWMVSHSVFECSYSLKGVTTVWGLHGP